MFAGFGDHFGYFSTIFHLQNSDSKETHSSYSSTIEKLPVEIRNKILLYITDSQTLSNLVHAVPTYHQAYLSVRNKILTNVTIHDLAARSIDIIHPTPVCELALNFHSRSGLGAGRQIALRGRSINIEDTTFRDQILQDMAEAMHTIFIHQLSTSSLPTTPPSRKLVLAVNHCLALRKISSIVPWQVTCNTARSIARMPGTGLINNYDRYCFHWACVHLVHIARDKDHITKKIKSDWIWPRLSPFAVDNGRLIHRTPTNGQ